MRATNSALSTQPTNLARDHPPKELRLERFREPHAQGLKPKRLRDPTQLSPGHDDFQFGFKRESHHKEHKSTSTSQDIPNDRLRRFLPCLLMSTPGGAAQPLRLSLTMNAGRASRPHGEELGTGPHGAAAWLALWHVLHGSKSHSTGR